jgi:cell division septal protein FtsQ
MSINEILLDLDINITSVENKNNMIFIKSKDLNIVSRYSNYQSRLEEFVSVYDQFQASYKSSNPVSVDLRYPTGFAVH